jgi:uncharacterized protein YhbP (UPF0306 family)
VLALSTVDAAGSYTTPLFYAVDSEPSAAGDRGPRLIFVSDPATAHGRMLGEGPTTVSATTYLESRDIAELRGVQLRGFVTHQRLLGTSETSRLTSLYVRAHPIARGPLDSASPPALYALEICWAKLTDNRLGFGTHRTVTYAGWNDPLAANTDTQPPG